MTSTFVNDLRLNEMATGDQSGSWGTVTNTNLELIGEALGYGTEGITTNANTHTSTIADGATDPVRALYVEYTGTLDSACTITIAPNTVNKVCFIENGTSGSQNIIIKQGSGATVTIPPGDTKAVYLDGAGSGAKVVDAFASLSVADLKVQGVLTASDDVKLAHDGAVLGFGAGNDVTLTHVHDTGLLLNSSRQLQFGDSATHIAQSADGVLTITSDNAIVLDAGGDASIDIDGADLNIKDGGVAYLQITHSSPDLHLKNPIQDGDILLIGNDGGANVTALKLDMSDAGAAFFSHDISLVDNGFVFFGAGQDLTLRSDGTNGIITAPNGNLTLDVGGDIILDADDGDIILKDGGTIFGQFSISSGDLFVTQPTQDKDIVFRGNDNNSFISALTLDMSDAGSAYFNNKVGVGTTSPTGFHNVNGNSAVNNIGYNLTFGGVGGGQNGVVFGMKIAAQTNNSSGDSYGLFSQAGQGVGGNTCGVYGDNHVSSLTQNSGARSIGVWGQCINNSGANGGSPYLANAQIKAGVLGMVTQINSSSAVTNAAVVANNLATSAALAYGVAIHTTAGPNAVRGLEYDHNGTVVLLIASTGNVTNANNSYGATSDLKLKENISVASSQWDDVKAIQVKKYSLKSDNLSSANQLGVIAQDLEASGMGGLVENDVMPITGEDGIVDPTQTETTKQVKYSVLYMKAVKALQEAMIRIEALETKVTALENA